MKKYFTCLLIAGSLSQGAYSQAVTERQEIVKLSEPYELANIILALTPYGKSDPWEVSQHSDYYREVRAHFDQFDDHPLLKRVDYSREKWDYYLSFRTDAYAFVFGNKDQLSRVHTFSANEGLNPFEENLELINDFVHLTGFRKFYKEHLTYYKRLAEDYLKSQQYDEMMKFLVNEFGQSSASTRYAIALSPLVGRMNCHRVVAGVNTDFITVPQFLLTPNGTQTASEAEVASGMHMLFTELDHGFVNPLSEKYRNLIAKNFTVAKWNNKSGYENDSLGVFNEYMTWALFDLFIHQRFPSVADEVCANWALQNATRGFQASSLFSRELLRIYHDKKKNTTIRELYPAIIDRIGKLQKDLSAPSLKFCNLADKVVADTVVSMIFEFTEAMQELRVVDVVNVITKDGSNISERLEIAGADVRWENGGSKLNVTLKLKKEYLNHIVFNYPWGTRHVLRSKKGIDLAPYTLVKVTVE